MRYIIENNYLIAELSDQGATLVKLIDKNTNSDLVLGYEKDEEYLENYGDFFGTTVGRNCNRIGNSEFILNDKLYKLNNNDGENNLHGGGINGFSFKKWNCDKYQEDKVTFSYYSKDNEEGFPGNLKTTVTYALSDNNLIFSFSGESDEDTIFNLTNHSYFNLDMKDILDLSLCIHTEEYSPTDEYGLTLDKVETVENTPYDFRTFRKIKDNLSKLDNGIDNNYVFEKIEDKLMCELKSDDIQLNVYSDLPDMHVYTAGHLDNRKGKDNQIYNKYAGIALECQYYPNAINYDNFMKPILRKGEIVRHYIRYEIQGL